MQKPSGMLVLPLNRTPFQTDFESTAKTIILEELKNSDCKVFLFGSRATNDNHRFSDMDIGIIPGKDFDDKILVGLREKLNESIVPFKVDLVDFTNVSQNFKDEALKEVVDWK